MGFQRKISNKNITKTLIFGISLGACISAFGLSYTIKKGDNLSQIAYRFIPGRVYGQRGSVRKLMTINPEVKNPNNIFIGQIIELGSELINQGPKEKRNDVLQISKSITKTDASKPFGILDFFTSFSSTKINATQKESNTAATVLSNSDFEIGVGYTQHWNNTFQSRLFFEQRKLSLSEPSRGGTTLDPEHTLYRFGASGNFRLSSKLNIVVSFANESVPFLVGISESEVSVKKVSVFALSSSLIYKWLELGSFTLESDLGTSFALPNDAGDFESELNKSFHATIQVKQKVRHDIWLNAGLSAEYKEQNTTIAQQNESRVGVFFEVILPFGI